MHRPSTRRVKTWRLSFPGHTAVQAEMLANPDDAAANAEFERLEKAILDGDQGPMEWIDGTALTSVWATP